MPIRRAAPERGYVKKDNKTLERETHDRLVKLDKNGGLYFPTRQSNEIVAGKFKSSNYELLLNTIYQSRCEGLSK